MRIDSIGVPVESGNNVSYKALYTLPKDIVSHIAGEPFANALEVVEPQLNQLAQDVNIRIHPSINRLSKYSSLMIYTSSLDEPLDTINYRKESAGMYANENKSVEDLGKLIIAQAKKCKEDFLNIFCSA